MLKNQPSSVIKKYFREVSQVDLGEVRPLQVVKLGKQD